MDLEDTEATQNVKKKINEIGRDCFVIKADLGVESEIINAVEEIISKLGGIDILVQCAGAQVPEGLMEVTLKDWYEAFDVDIHAILHLCRATMPNMKKRGEGAIVLISSAAGLRGCLGAIGYDVVKGAIPQFTRDLAREFDEYNIRVNCVAPGII